MASILNFVFALVIISLIAQGYCQCPDLPISQTQTGKTVQNKPEWQVTIFNNCSCFREELKLSCYRFQTVEPVDSSVLAKQGASGVCLVNNGQPIPLFGQLSFSYAWDTLFPFKTFSYTLT